MSKFLPLNLKDYLPSPGRFLSLLGAFIVSASTTSAVFATETTGFTRTPLLEKSVNLGSDKINAKVIRVVFPSGFKTPAHTHDGPGPRYVIKGKLKVSENGNEATYGAGEVFWESGQLMTVENIGQDTAELVIFEMAPKK